LQLINKTQQLQQQQQQQLQQISKQESTDSQRRILNQEFSMCKKSINFVKSLSFAKGPNHQL